MKTKLGMAHEYAIALINSDCEMQFDKFFSFVGITQMQCKPKRISVKKKR